MTEAETTGGIMVTAHDIRRARWANPRKVRRERGVSIYECLTFPALTMRKCVEGKPWKATLSYFVDGKPAADLDQAAVLINEYDAALDAERDRLIEAHIAALREQKAAPKARRRLPNITPKRVALSPIEAAVLDALKAKRELTTNDLATVTQGPRAEVKRAVRALCRAGRIAAVKVRDIRIFRLEGGAA